MKLLFDNNLSHKLCDRLRDLFPGSTQTRLVDFETAPDLTIWEYAKANGLVVVTLDKDFADIALMRGVPPQIIWLRCGNSSVATVEELLRKNFPEIEKFDSNSD